MVVPLYVDAIFPHTRSPAVAFNVPQGLNMVFTINANLRYCEGF